MITAKHITLGNTKLNHVVAGYVKESGINVRNGVSAINKKMMGISDWLKRFQRKPKAKWEYNEKKHTCKCDGSDVATTAAIDRLNALEKEQDQYSLKRQITREACPCNYVEPCMPDCTCREPYSSAGCLYCCSYGSIEQRIQRAKELIAQLRTGAREA